MTPTCSKTAVDVDQLAGHLAMLGRTGRAMPPAWKGAGVSVPIDMPGGGRLGRMLPGKGAYLDVDLKSLGITRPIPHVFERTPTQRAIEFLLDDRGSVTVYNEIIAARTTGARDFAFTKTSKTTTNAQWSSMFTATGVPGAGTYASIPGGSALTRASDGAISVFMSNPDANTRAYLLTFGYTAAQNINMGILVDMLVAADGISANSALSQTVNTTALTRYTGASAACNMLTFEVTVALGAGAANIVATYTNQSGTGSRTTVSAAMSASAITGRLQPVATGPFIEFANGDYGVRSVESVQLSGAMGSGSIAAIIYRPLSFLPGLNSNVYLERDSTTQIDGVTELAKDASNVLGCLNMFIHCGASASGIITGFIKSIVA